MAGRSTSEHREHLERLIDEAEQAYKRDPVSYRRKLSMLAGLGYVYLFGILLATMALIALCVVGVFKSQIFLLLLVKKKAGILLIGVFYILVKALWVRLDEPRGYKLQRKQYPRLFAEVDAMGEKLQAPVIHEIVLTPEFNAAIQQTPRLGVFGWYKNTLILGVLMMMSLDREQMLSVIAHEYGHLSGNHGRFSSWIYRVRMTWMRVMAAFDQAGGWAHVIFGKFFDWYAPYFNAWSFALARGNEYEADAVAVEMTSRQAFAEALTQTHIMPELMDKYYWPDIHKAIAESPRVNERIYSGYRERLRYKAFALKEKQELLDKALREKTGHTDTHPSLKDRIRPYSEKLTIPELPEVNAAEELFGDRLADLLRKFDSQWADDNAGWWRQRHEYLRKSKEELEKLLLKRKREKLNNDELWNVAAWTEELKPAIDPLPYYRAYWEKNPDAADGNYAIGRLLLDREDPEGLKYLDKAMANHRAVVPACQLAYSFYKGKGEETVAESYRLRAEKQMDLQNRAAHERADLYEVDEFLSDELPEEGIADLHKQFRAMKDVKQVWICRKKVSVFPDEPVYVLIYTSKWGKSHDELDQMIIKNLRMPGQYFVINKNGSFAAVAKRALKIARQVI